MNTLKELLSKIEYRSATIGIIGMGYVGLPLAVEFGKKFPTLGFDINQKRIDELKGGIDHTLECSQKQLSSAITLNFSTNPLKLKFCDIYIITVPTPIDANKSPDLRSLIEASTTVGKVLMPGNLVIYESTVYPGCIEEDCVPILEKESGLSYISSDICPPSSVLCQQEASGFYCGFSPERINPGDKEHPVTKILKVTSGSTPEAGMAVDALYKSIIVADTHQGARCHHCDNRHRIAGGNRYSNTQDFKSINGLEIYNP